MGPARAQVGAVAADAEGVTRAGELSAADRRARACSGLTSRLILSYVEREGGGHAVEQMLARSGLGPQEARLRDENAWFDFDTKMTLWAAAEEVLGDPRVAEHAGEAILDFSLGDGLKRAIQALGTPDMLFRNVVRANSKFNWAHRLDLVQSSPGRVRLRYVDLSGVGYHRYDCEYTAGLLRTVPQLFGLPPAQVHHPRCGARGAQACEFDVTWVSRPLAQRTAVGALVGAVAGLTVAGAVAVPVLLPAAAATALAGGAALALRRASLASHRMRALEREVHQQKEASTRMASSLGDLSAELRLDEVLEKVMAHARLAVGGTELVLLLRDRQAMDLDRHTGVPAETLAALERWASDQADALRAAPVVVDDTASAPGLESLATDPQLPIGSVCAASLTYRDEQLGTLIALAAGATVFLPHDSTALGSYAAQAAIAISNARLVERLERQAGEDALTGLANQRAFHQACVGEASRVARHGGGMAIVALDLDHFKPINDVYGHPFGDEILRSVAEAVRESVRPHDTVSRLGGEEFAVLLPGADASAARAVADRMRAAMGAILVGGRPLSCSAGVAAGRGAAVDPEQLLRRADRALYTAKARGRNRTVVHDPRGPGRDPAEALDELLSDGGVVPIFQPVVSVATGSLVAYEALARFPALPEHPAQEVFDAARRAGAGARLEAAALRAALAAGPPPPGILLNVNLSLSALCDDEAWAALPEDLSHLVVEVTEEEALVSETEVERALCLVRERGGRVAVDDAGAGSAGLRQLVQVRPEVVKLDRSLVRGIASDPARQALAASFAGFAEQTGSTVCAEGIEDIDDLRALTALGVLFAQGFLIARPGPPWPGVDGSVLEAAAAPLHAGVRVIEPAPFSGPSRGGARDILERMAAVTGAVETEMWAHDALSGELVAVQAQRSGPGARLPLAARPAQAHVLRVGDAGQVLDYDDQACPAELAELAAAGCRAALLVPIPPGPGARGVLICRALSARGWGPDAIARAESLAAGLVGDLAGSAAQA